MTGRRGLGRLVRPDLRRVGYGAVGTVVALAIWQATAAAADSANFPTASVAVGRLVEELGRGAFWSSIRSTLVQWGVGLALTTAIGVPLGLLIGRNRRVERLSRSSIDFFRAIPPIILLPLFVLLLGTSLRMVALIVLYGTVWPVIIHAIAGAENVTGATLETARSFKLGRLRTFGFVVLPGAAPHVLTGLRIAGAVALFVAVAAQLVASAPGIGRDIALAQLVGDVELVYALIVAAGVLGLAINSVLVFAERVVLAGHGIHQREAT